MKNGLGDEAGEDSTSYFRIENRDKHETEAGLRRVLREWTHARPDTCLLSSDSERVFSHRVLLSLHSRSLRSQVPTGDLEEGTSESEVSCHQTENYETVSSSVEAECQYLVQLTCSSCHFHALTPALPSSPPSTPSSRTTSTSTTSSATLLLLRT